ncbi:hypothetical protein SDC9_164492 [bioreactor metagenome]|uniref:Uncharacterized protein n=1 Tax=bioreactor metagenome TaxID=1076179 RepID=A0A645FU18_9ZZZZ
MKEPNKSNDLLSAWSFHPIITNTNVTITKEAIVIPETGRLDVPIVPVKRPATITNNKDNKSDSTAPTIAIVILPDIINAAINPTIAPPNNIIICIDELSPPVPLALVVSLTEAIIVGISFIAPIIPPNNIIPAPIYLT